MNYAKYSIFNLDKESLQKLPAEELPLSTYYEIGDYLSMTVSDLLRKCLGDEYIWVGKTFLDNNSQTYPTFSFEIAHILEDSLRAMDTKLFCFPLSSEEAEELGYDWKRTVKLTGKAFKNENSYDNVVYVVFHKESCDESHSRITGVEISKDLPLYALLDSYKILEFFVRQAYTQDMYTTLSKMSGKELEELDSYASHIEDTSMRFQMDIKEITKYKDVPFPLPGTEILAAYTYNEEKSPAIVTGLSFNDDILIHYDFQDASKGSAIFPLKDYGDWWTLSEIKTKEQTQIQPLTM